MINLLAATDQKSSLVVKPGPSPIPILTDSSIYVFFVYLVKKVLVKNRMLYSWKKWISNNKIDEAKKKH